MTDATALTDSALTVIVRTERRTDSSDVATATHETPYGLASAGWGRVGDEVVVEATVPANTTALVRLPGVDGVKTVGSGTHEWTVHIPADTAEREAVWATIAKHDEDQARVFRRHTTWTPGRKLGEVMFQISPPVQGEVGAALDALSATRR